MNKDVLEIDGKYIVLDEKGPKGECYNRKDLMDILAQENKVDYLEGKIDNCKNSIAAAKVDIASAEELIKPVKWAQAIVTAFTIAGGICVAMFAEFSAATRFIIGLTIPSVGFGIFEIVKQSLSSEIAAAEKKIDYYKYESKFLEDDLAKEKEKKISKVNYKKPSYKLIKVDTTELDKCVDKYSGLHSMYEAIPTVEAPEEMGKRISLKR